MQVTKKLYVTSRAEWRKWLKQNYKSEPEIWLISYRKDSGQPRVEYNDAVEEALCFGWIDSTLKKIDEQRFAQRFSPRRRGSSYSQLNKERLQGLAKQGKLMPEVLAGLADIDPELFNKHMPKDQNGFSVIHFLLFAVVAAAVSFIGWYVYDSNKKSGDSLKEPLSQEVGSTPPKKIVAVGDIACDPNDSHFSGNDQSFCQSDKTHALLALLKPDAILALGDLQYEDGTLDKFMKSYDKDWGKEKPKTYPAPGNHEYVTPNAVGYFDYFNGDQIAPRAGEKAKGYYSTDVGSWHIIALNSNCKEVGGCDENSPQNQWLREDLVHSSRSCTLAFWHHPHFSSGRYANDVATTERTTAFWDTLLNQKADVILNGHDHLYERFAPQTSAGKKRVDGIRQFTAGTGGKVLYKQTAQRPNSEKLIDDQFGVLTLELYPKAYKWQFVSIAGKGLDSGTHQCTS